MAANNGSTGPNQNFYNIAYGMFKSKFKNKPEDKEEISLTELKRKTLAVENVDLRKLYVKGEGDYPYAEFFSSISGKILSVEKDVYDQGISLKITILDLDNEQSVLTTSFYGKVASNLMNRLVALESTTDIVTFNPYAVPDNYEGRAFYQSGVVLYQNDKKVLTKFKQTDGLPSSERVQDAQGKEVTSRVKQNNFLWLHLEPMFAKEEAKFNAPPAQTNTAPAQTNTAPAQTNTAPAQTNTAEEDDDLPF